MNEHTYLSELIPRLAADAKLLKLADEDTGDRATWREGYCWHFAEALRRFLGKGEIWAVRFEDRLASHVVVRIGDMYCDSIGYQTAREILVEHDSWFSGGPVTSSLRPFATANPRALSIPGKECITRMAPRMARIAKS